MPLTARNKQLIVTGVMVVIIVVGAWLGFEQYKAVAAQQDKVTVAAEELQAAEQELADLKELSNTMDSMSVELNNVRSSLPAGEDISDLLANLEAIAVYSGVTFDSISVATSGEQTAIATTGEEVATPAGVNRINLAISVTGGYQNLKKYLHGIEQNLRIIDVNSISISEGGVYLLNMQTYYVE